MRIDIVSRALRWIKMHRHHLSPVSTSKTRTTYTDAESKAEFDLWSKSYNKSILQRLLFVPSHNCLLENISIGNRQLRLLDIGCGTGILVKRVSECYPDAKVYGIDLSHDMIRYGLLQAENCQFAQANCESLPFADNSFDIVTSSNSFHHYPNQARAVNEMHRVLKPDGKLMIIDGYCDRSCPWGWFIYDVCVVALEGAVHHASAQEFRKLFTGAGFDDIRQQAKLGLAPFLLTMGTKAKV